MVNAETDILTPLEAAKYLRVHRETLYDLIRSGTIKASKIGGRWRLSRAILDSYLQKDAPAQASSPTSDRDSRTATPTLPQISLVGQLDTKFKRILVVDDSPDIRELFEVALVKRGHAVFTVSNGYDAIDYVKRNVYDVIFIDLVMPDLDGVETLKGIKAIDPDPTIVLITGNPDGDLVAKALGMGPFVLLDKPIRVGDVLKVVEG